MTNANLPPEIPIRNFDAAKQTTLFQTLKMPQFTGRLILTDPRSHQWSFFLYFGRLVYASGGTHSVRRWRRHLTAQMPHIAANTQLLQQGLSAITSQAIKLHWEYDLIQTWHGQQRITRDQIRRMIEAIATEIFFEVSQSTQVTYHFDPVTEQQEDPLILIDPAQSILRAWRLFEQWNNLEIAHLSPQVAPVIVKPDLLQARSSEANYQLLTSLVTGRRTFWDLSIRLKQDVPQVARLLMPYMKLGFIDVKMLDDLSSPLTNAPPQPTASKPVIVENQSLIAYLSLDSKQHQHLRQILKQQRYRYLAIADLTKALPDLLTEKPNLILLDLELDGNTNGLEFCTQLKKLSLFRQTPVLIMTDNNRLFDRVKGRLTGVTDFVSKTSTPDELRKALQKYLR
ncbi:MULTISPECIES: response regulator [Cyanophyceae]|uniref:response regulator n=1 Tax=Cyanophyceae TaxID=3028117 RepID=UPI00016DCD99|nr:MULTISPECIES: response regulator [Cyanophyceae]ACB00511.1 chemotaxis protein CheY [Picosynechococcus sp. PCC 7002]SMH50006.1 two-component system, chemotaxis family, response regulator PixG [Picosynechococcus sp. OG1]SMQ81708.1 two-component system, chemotaxis family, response regulator PixG [Synechococcus sp. 7002]